VAQYQFFFKSTIDSDNFLVVSLMESAQLQSIMKLLQLGMELMKEATLTGLSEIHGDKALVRLVILEFSH
jgi:hypothetical protein